MPLKPETNIDVLAFKEELDKVKDKLTTANFARGEKALDFLENGAPSYQKDPLPGCFVPNAESALKNGAQITDKYCNMGEKRLCSRTF